MALPYAVVFREALYAFFGFNAYFESYAAIHPA
jgi:hypothetical protein